MANYSEVDPALYAWARKHGLHVHTKYQDEEVRSVEVVSNSGKRYQIWVDPPEDGKKVHLHAWDYERRRVEMKCSPPELGEKLEAIYAAVRSWEGGFFGALFKRGRRN